MDLTSLTNKPTAELIEILPKLGVVMALSSLAKQNATRRNGVQPWMIDRTIGDCIQALQVNQANQATGLLPTLQNVLGGGTVQQAQPSQQSSLEGLLKQMITSTNKQTDAFNRLCERLDPK